MRNLPVLGEGATDEVHIASFVVHVVPAHVQAVARQVADLPGAEVHAATPEGKVVVTLEARGAAPILSTAATIGQMPGVINVALVYQCADTEESMNEELPDAHCTQGVL